MSIRPAGLLVIVALAAACEKRVPDELPECDLNAISVSDSSVGPLHVGEAVGAARVRCPSLADTMIMVPAFDVTDSIRALRLVVRGLPVVATYAPRRSTAGPQGPVVTALHVDAPAFRTSDSTGVGTGISAFRGQPGIRVSLAGDPPRVLLRDQRRCGVVYELSGWGGAPSASPGDPPVTGAQLAAWPDSITVSAITVTGCFGAVRDLRIDSALEAASDPVAPADSPAIATPAIGTLASSESLPAVAALPLPAERIPPPRAATASVAASTRELEELKAALAIPVQGVSGSQLRDTYAESRGARVHEALDIPAPRGTPVLSAADGRLLKLFDSKAGGLMVYAGDASDRFVLLYGHLDRYADGLREGMALRRGQTIGYVGTTGNAPPGTPHLHFAILRGQPSRSWWRGTPVNPYPLLSGR